MKPSIPDCLFLSNPLEPGAKACSRCGTIYTPDAWEAKSQIEADMKRSYAQTDPGDEETLEKLDELDELLADSAVQRALLERIET